MATNDQVPRSGIYGAAEHFAHRKVDDMVEKLLKGLPLGAQQFIALNKGWLVNSLEALAYISSFVRPDSQKWDVIQTAFSSMVEGLERAAKSFGTDNVAHLPADITHPRIVAFNSEALNLGLFAADGKDGKKIAVWIKELQAEDPELARHALKFVGGMTPLALSHFAMLLRPEKTAVLKASVAPPATPRADTIKRQRLALGRVNRQIARSLVQDQQALDLFGPIITTSEEVRAQNLKRVKKTFGWWSMLKLVPILGLPFALLEAVYLKIKKWRANRNQNQQNNQQNPPPNGPPNGPQFLDDPLFVGPIPANGQAAQNGQVIDVDFQEHQPQNNVAGANNPGAAAPAVALLQVPPNI